VPLHFVDEGDLDPNEEPALKTRFFRDTSRSLLTRNDSPDVGFEVSINPYRGCEHGCIYCYARPTHEYLGLSAGLDFETQIFVKEDAPELLRAELSHPLWEPQTVALSGVTDPYQPVERKLKLTRRCLEILRDCGNPVFLITKNHLVERDIDILAEMAGYGAAGVMLSVTTLDAELCARMEPRTAPPARRLAAIERLARAGIPVGVMMAPIVPGLTDHEILPLLQAAAASGASWAGYVVLRLPFAVAGLFERWLSQHYPDRQAKILNRIRDLRGGKRNDPEFGSRMRGSGIWAQQLEQWFRTGCRKARLAFRGPSLSTDHFRRPPPLPRTPPGQMTLF
jgi:DNA repair photolyase